MIKEIDKSILSLAAKADDAKENNATGSMQLSQAVLNLANARAVIKNTDFPRETSPAEALPIKQIVGICNFRGQVIVATDTRIYRIVDNQLAEISFKEIPPGDAAV